MGAKVRPRDLPQHRKTNRAFRAYINLMDAADWLRGEMSEQLVTWNLTMLQFRILEALFREGPHYQQLLSDKFRCRKQSMALVVERLEKWGMVRRDRCRLPSSRFDHVEAGFPAGSGKNWRGRWIALVTLTPKGKRLIGFVIVKHKKVVKAWMRALEGREQETLARLCGKLTGGDIVKFVREIRMEDR
ncbi:MAG: MarR family winged helix-turn-helix transcriptional regulator [Candidatus Acidiferrales bacterium]